MPNPVLDQERVQFLKAREKKSRNRLLPPWPRMEKELPFVELEVDWVRLSTLNHRTRAEQLSAIHKSGNSRLFTADPMGPIAQKAQYDILRAQEGFDVLKHDLSSRKQQDPAVVTADGVLINGNRRTAALRSLYHDDNNLSAKYVQCLVLPEDSTSEEILDLEAELQVARDFKEEYSWINEALLIEELCQKENRSFERVALKMHRTEPDVRSYYEKLQQVHQLVAMSNGARQYVDFVENESAFDELAKHIRNKPLAEAESVRQAYFLGTLANVNYRKLRHLRRPDASSLIVEEFSKDPALKPLMESIEASEHPVVANDPLDAVLGSPEPLDGLGGVLSFLATKKPTETLHFPNGDSAVVQDIFSTVQSAINAAAAEAEEEVRDQTAVVAPIMRSKKAIEELNRAVLALPRARAFKDWDENVFREQLIAIDKLIAQMRTAQ